MKKLTALSTTATLYFLMVTNVLAQTSVRVVPQIPREVSTPSDIQSLVNKVIRIFFIFGGVMVVIMLRWGAVEWILSGGNKEKVASARGRIINALIGLAILALAFLIAKFVGGAIGFDPFNTPNINLGNNNIPIQNEP
jgi:hypothetical protein